MPLGERLAGEEGQLPRLSRKVGRLSSLMSPSQLQNPDAQSGLFQSLEVLKKHPTYLMVFLQHVVLQFDSSPVVRLSQAAHFGVGWLAQGCRLPP